MYGLLCRCIRGAACKAFEADATNCMQDLALLLHLPVCYGRIAAKLSSSVAAPYC